MIDAQKYAPSVEAFLKYYLHHLPRIVYNESEIATLPDLQINDVIMRMRIGKDVDSKADTGVGFPQNGVGYTIWVMQGHTDLGNQYLRDLPYIVIKPETVQGKGDGLYAYELSPQTVSNNITNNQGQWETNFWSRAQYIVPSVYAVQAKLNQCLHKGLIINGTDVPTQQEQVYSAMYIKPYLTSVDSMKSITDKALTTDDMSTSVYDLETPSPVSGRAKTLSQDLIFRLLTRIINDDTAAYGVGSNGLYLIQTTGTKYQQRAYLDRNTLKIYICTNTTTDTTPTSSNFKRLAAPLDDTAV